MKLVCKRSIPIILLILALVILALVALSPGFVWSQTAPQGPSVTSRGGARMAQQTPPATGRPRTTGSTASFTGMDGRLGSVIGPFSQPCSQTGNSKEAI